MVNENELVDLFLNEHKALSDSILNDYKSITEFAWEQFSKSSLDLNRAESWRYFPFSKLLNSLKDYANYEAPTKIVEVGEEDSEVANNSIKIVSGCLDKINQLNDNIEVTQTRYADKNLVNFFDHFFKHEQESAKNPLVFLNGSLSTSAILINVKPSEEKIPTLKINLLSNEPGVSWPMIGFNILEKASLNVEIHVNSEDDKSLLIGNFFAKIKTQGELNIDIIQCDNHSNGIIFQNRFVVENAAHLKLNGFCRGGQFNRFDTEILMTNENSNVDVNFLSLTKGNSQQHHFINMSHDAPNCNSSQLFRNLLFDKSNVSVDGTVLVQKGASQTFSEQLINNLFFSEEAKASTKPNLQILNDDVKCNHGVTFGQLEEESLFYLKSRGLPEELAIDLLTKSFASEVIEKFHSEEMKTEIKKLLEL